MYRNFVYENLLRLNVKVQTVFYLTRSSIGQDIGEKLRKKTGSIPVRVTIIIDFFTHVPQPTGNWKWYNRPVRLTVRTSRFQRENKGSIPLQVTNLYLILK